MNELIILALIAALPGMLSAIFGFFNAQKLTEIHVSINSRMDELLRTKTSEAKEMGRAEGVNQERKRGES